MLFKVYHIANKPIELEHRDLFSKEWKEKSGQIMTVTPDREDIEAWRKLNDSLNVLEDELREKYPCKAEWNIESASDIQELVQQWGTLSFCVEDDAPVIYLMDLPNA